MRYRRLANRIGNTPNSYWLILFSTSSTKSEGQSADLRGNDDAKLHQKRLPPAGLRCAVDVQDINFSIRISVYIFSNLLFIRTSILGCI